MPPVREPRGWLLSPTCLWLLAALFTLVWFGMLGARTLVPTDEGRYAEMAREMLASGDWITTRLNGIKYFEKPPLQIWITALTFKFFGLGEWQARLWTGLCGFAGIVLTGIGGARVFGRPAGLAAMLVLASTLFWAAMGHINTLDMGLSGGMTLTLCAMLIAQMATATGITAGTLRSMQPVGSDAAAATRRRWMLACWAGMGLAVLSKGLIGLALPGAVLIVYTLVSRDWAIWKRLHLVSGLLLFALITVPWFVLVSLRNPEFPQFFFIHEHFQRFTTRVHHRYGPWFYFLPILVAGLLPWLGVAVQSLWAAARERETPVLRARGATGEADAASVAGAAGFQPKKLLLVWAVLIFVFFSVSDSKLPSYILPIFPALALLIGPYLLDAPRRAWWLLGGSMTLLGAVMLALVPRMPQFAKGAIDLANYQAAQPWVVAAALALLAGALPVLWWCWQSRARALAPTMGATPSASAAAGSVADFRYAASLGPAMTAVPVAPVAPIAPVVPLRALLGERTFALQATLVLSVAAFAAVQLLMLGAEYHGRTRAGVSLVAATAAELTPSTPLYAVGLYDQTLPFYLRRTMTLVAHPDELEFGLQQEPALWLPTIDQFIARWKNGTKAVAVTRPEIYARLQAQGLPMRVIAQDERRIVITNQ